MREIESLNPGNYNICFTCPARTQIPEGHTCNQNFFATLSRSGRVRSRPYNCPLTSGPTEATQAAILRQLQELLGK